MSLNSFSVFIVNVLVKFMCNKCERIFNSKIVLNSHEKIHLKVEKVCQVVALIDDHEKLKSQLLDLDFN